MSEFIERKIVLALITSTEFTKQIRSMFSARMFTSATAKRLSVWCVEYYDKHDHAPGKDIEGIFFEKLKNGLSREVAKDIEEDILPHLSEEYIENGEQDITTLVQQTETYFQERHVSEHADKIQALIETGEILEAEKLLLAFKPLVTKESQEALRMGDREALASVDHAFETAQKPLIYYPKQLGQYWNHQLVAGGFVSLMASEKRGKTYLLMDMSVRASRQGKKVAFFQAGDMTEGQLIRRYCIHLAKNSDLPQYCGEMFEPVRDCVQNQLDMCSKKCRECTFGVFNGKTEKELRYGLTLDELKEAYTANPDYKACHNCIEYTERSWGVPWLVKVTVPDTLDQTRAHQVYEKHFVSRNRQIMLSSHANGTLSILKIKALLSMWEKLYEFVPEVIIIDYADLLVPESGSEFRHQQNQIWKGLRNLSQEYRGGVQPLVVTATQADADSYGQFLLNLKNFSEDKRKYAHCTAMYGLNQDPKGREKHIGIMRINELVIREGECNNDHVCYVLQNLKRGQPVLASYF